MTSHVAKNTLYSSINIYVEYFIGFAISIFIAKSLGPSEYGSYAYFIKIAAIAIIFVSSGVNTGVVKFVAEARAKGSESDVSSIYAYFSKVQRGLIAVACCILLIMFYLRPEWLLGDDLKYIVFFLLVAVAFKSAHMFRVSNCKGHERFDYLAFTVLIVAPINLLIILVAFAGDFGRDFYLYCYCFICFLYWVTSGYFLRKIYRNYPKPKAISNEYKSRVNHHLRVVSVNAVIAALGVGQCEVLFLKQMVDSAAVSYFAVANSISGAAILLVPGVYSAVLFPVIARAVADDNLDPAQKIQQSGRYLFMLGLLVAVPTSLFSEALIVSLYGVEFVNAGAALSAFILVGVLSVYVQPVSAYLMSVDKQSMLLKLSILNMFLALVLTYLLVRAFGFEGAIISFVVVRLIMSAMFMYLAWRQLGLLPQFLRFAVMLFAAIVAGLFTRQLSGYYEGIVEVIVGFASFGLCYVFLVYVLRGLNDEDYLVMDHYASSVSGRKGKLIASIARFRLGGG